MSDDMGPDGRPTPPLSDSSFWKMIAGFVIVGLMASHCDHSRNIEDDTGICMRPTPQLGC